MASAGTDSELLKRVLKEALAETLQEQRALLREVFAEVLEDFALAEAIREGQATEAVSRDRSSGSSGMMVEGRRPHVGDDRIGRLGWP